MRIRTIIATAAGVLAISLTPTSANAASRPTPGVDSSTLPGEPGGAGGSSAAFAGFDAESGKAVRVTLKKNAQAQTVGCWVEAEAPFTLVYNKPPIRAQGEISRCTSPKPDDCRVETDLEEYFPVEGEWRVVANGPVKRGCSIGRNSRSATAYNCTHDAHGGHKYRTRTWLTITYRGQHATNVATSGEKSWWCF